MPTRKIYFFKKALLFAAAGLFAIFLFILPATLFDKPHSTVLYASDGRLLNAIIAGDGQWRFPHNDSVPEKFRAALIAFEDRHFYNHSGIYLPSLLRAVYQNLVQQKVVSGASTISMQVVRMSRNNPSRTVWEKITEMLAALRLEWRYSKSEILSLYASNAPFGGNVVGLDAAAWRYYGRNINQLSWAESATLAVLPNAPSLIFPGKNQELLLEKRNRVLNNLHKLGYFDSATLELSRAEPLPQKPCGIPQGATHLLHTLVKSSGAGERYTSTIDHDLQMKCQDLVQRHGVFLADNLVYNAAVLVVEVRTGNVLAYVGNVADASNGHGCNVDIIRAPRSTGSILKPILYAASLRDGLILPNTLVADIPIQYDGFSPKNYHETFDGAVPASRALSRSLNIPSVVMLKEYGYQRFCHLLQKIGFSYINKPADHYGLSLILGGAESSLWDITHTYAGMSRALVHYYDSNGKYQLENYSMRHAIREEPADQLKDDQFPLLNAGSIWCTYQALLEVNRPETELGWETYTSSAPIAWKTGTSFGNRDAWAVGTTPEYVVGVWTGNADGQGRPLLTGLTSSAPLLFEVFGLLPRRTWFTPPFDDLSKVTVCRESGMLPGVHCEALDTILAPAAGIRSKSCPFHRTVFTNATTTQRVTASCASPGEMFSHSWFVLPPVQEHYYKARHPEYRMLPPFAPGCGSDDSSPIGLIYPKSDAQIFIPRSLDGQRQKVVLEATHRAPDGVIYWHLDGEYLGQTKAIHQMEITPDGGRHVLTLVDQDGYSLVKEIDIMLR